MTAKEFHDKKPPMHTNPSKPKKPLNMRAYGSIPHLPGSRRGPGDKGLSLSQARILLEKCRAGDVITVQEKLDGSNVCVANIGGEIVPLIRAGYHACDSIYEQHHHFARWVETNIKRFINLLHPGERVGGEWLMQVHGTLYTLPHEPFVPFDILQDHTRVCAAKVKSRCEAQGFVTPHVLHEGALSIEDMLKILEPSAHGAQEVEGAVWRAERGERVDFLGKYVRPEKEDGKYLDGEPIYNWYPNA